MPLQHVSDTALWVAAYRAHETDRPDALFRDPLARQLAGPEGEHIARELGGGLGMEAGMAVRTRLIDDWILRAVRESGVDVVLNLACGLDTRPYRLALPEKLLWIEADLSALVDFKESRLGAAKPVCRFERCKVDLADGAARTAFLADKLRGCRKALVLTEGLLCYLTPAQVQALALELRAQPGIALWITDLFSPGLLRMTQRMWGKRLEQGNAAVHFGAESSEFLPWGWRVRESGWVFEEARRLHRDFAAARYWRPIFSWLPGKVRQFIRQTYSIVLFEVSDT